MDLDSTLEILQALARQHAEGSPEEEALRNAAQALLYVRQAEVEAKFRDWLAELDRPTALQVLHAKLMGIEIPHELSARSALGASGLALGGRVELECIAVVGTAAG
jgi:hypothetical protein